MGRLMYFLAGRSAVSEAALVESGLDRIVTGGVEQVGTQKGPDGGRGVVFASPAKNGKPLGCRPGQTWIAAPAKKFWLGYEEKPGPDDLARERMRGGNPVRLGDGNEWVFPKYIFLNRTMAYDEEGNICWRVSPEEQRYAEDGERLFELLKAIVARRKAGEGEQEIEMPMTMAELAPILVRFLGLNYRLGEPEVVLLGLFRDDLMLEPLMAIMNMDEISKDLEARKKKESLQPDRGGSAGAPD